MSFLRTLFVGCVSAYALGWLRYFIPVVPRNADIKYYQSRLDLLRKILDLLKQMGDAYYTDGIDSLVAKLGISPTHRFEKIQTIDADFPYDLWPVLSKHINYTTNKYRKIGKFGVTVTSKGPAGMNLPFYPGLILAEFAILNMDYGFACDLFLHESYHDFYIGHGRDVDAIDGMWDIDIPLRRGLVEPAKLFGVLEEGAFGQYINWLRSHVDASNNSLWTYTLHSCDCYDL